MVIVGAGILGIYQLYRAVQAGYSVRLLEQGGGVGGTWYWNRYPGCRFDSESYTYGYLFSEELWQEWDWSEEFAPQPETERYLNHVVDKFDLRRHIRLNSKVTSAVWDEGSASWTTGTEDGFADPVAVPDRRHRRAVGAAVPRRAGPRGLPGRVLPPGALAEGAGGLPRQARRRHRHRLDRRPDRPGDRGRGRVAGDVPALRHLGHAAEQPPDLGRAAGVPQGELRADQGRARRLGRRLPAQAAGKKWAEDTPEQRQAFFESVWNSPGFAKISTNYEDLLFNQEANADWCAFMADKIRAIVKDPATAEKLIPTDHLYVGLRPPYVTDYYEMYNKPNVELVSLRETPDRQGHRDRDRDVGRAARVRHHHLGDRLRLRHRRHAADGHRRRGRAAAQRLLGRRAADLPRDHDPRVPELLLPRRPARRGGQQPALRRNSRSTSSRTSSTTPARTGSAASRCRRKPSRPGWT